MYLLALHWTHQRSTAFIAGLIFAFAPYRFAAIAHLQLLTFQWLPFIILFVDWLISNRKKSLYYLQTSCLPSIQFLISYFFFLPAPLYLALSSSP
jgi:hypothetical protein